MAKKKAKAEETIIDEDLLGSEIEIKEPEIVAVIKQPSVETSKNKTFIGYHPISGEEVWA
jgi:hypothetical protein